MTKLKLIAEDIDDIGSVIVEGVGGEKKYYIEGPFIQTEIFNRNKRKYPRQMMEEEVANYARDMISTRRAIGELNHPPTPALNPERASHLIESLTPDSNNWIGRARVLGEMPMGKLVKGLIIEGVAFGVSTRGVGALKNTSNGTIVENYKLSTAADIVSDPSGPDAWVRGIMEGAEWIYDQVNDGWIKESTVEQLKTVLDKPKRLVSEETKLAAFERFITELANQNKHFTK